MRLVTSASNRWRPCRNRPPPGGRPASGTIYRDDPNRPAYLEWARDKVEEFRGCLHRRLEWN
jgi:hypothetical protein